MIRERLSEYKNFPGIFREVFFIFYCRLTEFSRNKTLRDFPATKLPFAEFPLTFFPFSFCGGVCPSAAGFPILSFRGFSVFLYGISPPFLYVFSRPFLLGVSPSFPVGFFCFSPRFFRQSCNKKTPRIIRGVFALFTFSRTRSLGPDRRWWRHSPNRTYNSPSRKPKADR